MSGTFASLKRLLRRPEPEPPNVVDMEAARMRISSKRWLIKWTRPMTSAEPDIHNARQAQKAVELTTGPPPTEAELAEARRCIARPRDEGIGGLF